MRSATYMMYRKLSLVSQGDLEAELSDGERRVNLDASGRLHLANLVTGSDKVEALPAITSSKAKGGDSAVVEDVQRVCPVLILACPSLMPAEYGGAGRIVPAYSFPRGCTLQGAITEGTAEH